MNHLLVSPTTDPWLLLIMGSAIFLATVATRLRRIYKGR